MNANNLNIKIYADGASIDEFTTLNKLNFIKGFTTNPTLMRKNNISNYEDFAIKLTNEIPDKPISFEVFADNLDEMYDQAKKINNIAENIFVKIPITNTKGKSTDELVNTLLNEDIKINLTAIFLIDQCENLLKNYQNKTSLILSYFAGRVADTGVDPIPHMIDFINQTKKMNNIKILWASPREVLNIKQANDIGCDIITVTKDLLDKLKLFNKDLRSFSLETVKMFYDDAQKSGYKI